MESKKKKKQVYRGKLCFNNKLRTLSNMEKRKIHERDDYTCQYCLSPSECIDHILPYSFYPDDSPDNLVAACNMCNLLASNRIFKDFVDKKLFIVDAVTKICKKSETKIWTIAEIKELDGRLRKYVARNSIIVNTEEEAKQIKEAIQRQKDGLLKFLEEELTKGA